MLHVYTNGTDTAVAVDLDDVQRVIEAHYGATFEQEGWSLDEWRKVADDKPITIRNIHDRGWDDVVTMAAREWAGVEGRCFLCSTEW